MPATRTEKQRRDPYEVLGVARNSTDQEVKSAYRRMALKYHPDKNANDPVAADVFKEVAYSYSILADPDKRRRYDTSGFEGTEPESQEWVLDLSSLSTVNTMFAALFSKLGVPIKTTVSATVLEEALNGMVSILPLQLGQYLSNKVEKQSCHFYSVEITEEEAEMGFVCRVHSTEKSKFKEDSAKTGRGVTSSGMFFLRFPVYRFDQANSMAFSKDPDAALFKKLDGFQPCEINELKAGTHVFAVYGDDFFKSAHYTIEVMCAEPFLKENKKLRDVQARILTKRVELSKFETEYREVLSQFTEMTSRYDREMQEIDELLKERNVIQSSYTTIPPLKRSISGRRIRTFLRGSNQEKRRRESGRRGRNG